MWRLLSNLLCNCEQSDTNN